MMTPKKLLATGGTLLSAGGVAIAAGHYIGGGIVCFAGLAAIAMVVDMRAKRGKVKR